MRVSINLCCISRYFDQQSFYVIIMGRRSYIRLQHMAIVQSYKCVRGGHNATSTAVGKSNIKSSPGAILILYPILSEVVTILSVGTQIHNSHTGRV